MHLCHWVNSLEAVYQMTCSLLWSHKRLYTTLFTCAVKHSNKCKHALLNKIKLDFVIFKTCWRTRGLRMKVLTCVACSSEAGCVCFTVLHVCPPETAALNPTANRICVWDKAGSRSEAGPGRAAPCVCCVQITTEPLQTPRDITWHHHRVTLTSTSWITIKNIKKNCVYLFI